MSSDKEQIRIVAGSMDDGASPFVAGAISQTTWEIIEDEEWEEMRRTMIRATGVHEADFLEWRDIVIEVDRSTLTAAMSPPRMAGAIVDKSEACTCEHNVEGGWHVYPCVYANKPQSGPTEPGVMASDRDD